MELQILKLVYNYSIFKKTADNTFVEKIVEIFVSSRQLDDYVKNVIFTNKLHRNVFADARVAAYDFLNKEILIDFEFIQIFLEDMNKYNIYFNELEQLIFKNLLTAQIILHTLEIAVQKRQIDNENDNSIETKLIRESFEADKIISKKQNNPTLLDFYEFCRLRNLIGYYCDLEPAAKLADINSFKTILKSIEPIKKRVPNLYEFIETTIEERMLCCYQDSLDINKCICPTKIFLNWFNWSSWYDLDFYDSNICQLMKNVTEKYTLDERLSLGLPISHNEYENAVQRLKRKNRFIKKIRC